MSPVIRLMLSMGTRRTLGTRNRAESSAVSAAQEGKSIKKLMSTLGSMIAYEVVEREGKGCEGQECLKKNIAFRSHLGVV